MKLALVLLGSVTALGLAAMAVFVFVVQNVETPRHVTVLQDGAFEVRDYPPLVVAEVRRQGTRQESLREGFGPLARYIFAREREGERIAMTAPVVQQPGESIATNALVTQSPLPEGDWAIRFIMPAQYRLADLPLPAGADVRLREVPARRTAVVRFGGRADDALLAQQEQALRAWLQRRGLRPAAAPVFAYYNDPLTPGFLQRNEILIDLAADAAARAATH